MFLGDYSFSYLVVDNYVFIFLFGRRVRKIFFYMGLYMNIVTDIFLDEKFMTP